MSKLMNPRYDADLRSRFICTADGGLAACAIVLGGLYLVAVVITALVVGFVDEHNFTLGYLWLVPGLLACAWLASCIPAHEGDGHSSDAAEATRIYKGLNKGHKEIARPVVDNVYKLVDSGADSYYTRTPINERLNVLRSLQAKEQREIERRVTTDKSDITLVKDYLALDNQQSIH